MKSNEYKNFPAIIIVLVIVALVVAGCLPQQKLMVDSESEQQLSLPEMSYVGRQTCAKCHAGQDQLWQGSHHDLAMQEANEQTVLGDFDNIEFSEHGVTTRFFRKDGRFFVNTDGPDGQLADFEVKYTFGVTPLQQYLIEFSGGRLQAFSIAWDSRMKAHGGQRWFHLYLNERIDFRHELHWTKRLQNWNFMCAECHSTNLQKNYNPLDRTYNTRWSEINVACEACHGPASHHVSWAERGAGFDQIDAKTKGLAIQFGERRNIDWKIDAVSGNARRELSQQSGQEMQVCARCHSRRTQLFGEFRHGSLLDSHLPSLLHRELYHVDGQAKEEVYEYGSFLQSRMYQAGVICSDCHEPHSLKLRAAGNEVCMQCHAGNKYDTESHHFHEKGLAGSQCVDCHMPMKTYMVVDSRRDHSFSIPRPDLSEQLGTPNTCTGCHASKTAQWAADKVREWYGHQPTGYQNYAETFHAIRSGAIDALDRLMTLQEDKNQPIIARATAVEELDVGLSARLLTVMVDALYDSDPLMRSAGLNASGQLPPEQRWMMAHERLHDPVRGVRALAVATLAEVPAEHMTSGQRIHFQEAADDYLRSLRFNADDPGAQVSLGNFYAARGELTEAEQAYREALVLDVNWVSAYVNYADLLRKMNRDEDGERLLRDGLIHQPDAGALHHSLGLLHVRKKDLPRALAALKQATELEPEIIHYGYIYAIALHSTGQLEAARAVIKSALTRAPNNPALNALKAQLAGND